MFLINKELKLFSSIIVMIVMISMFCISRKAVPSCKLSNAPPLRKAIPGDAGEAWQVYSARVASPDLRVVPAL